MKVAIVGCGLIGRKRAMALDPEDSIAACCDIVPESADKFGAEFSCPRFTDWRELLRKTECDAFIVAVVNKFIREITVAALESGKHVLAEKPLGRNAEEARAMVEALERRRIPGSKPRLQAPVLKTGFNHRFHPAIWRAKEICDAGGIGSLFSIRARYGHGARPGMETEWRSSRDLCGGGELLDQGVHVIDLVRWFGGEVTEAFGKAETRFWPIEVEDNAWALLTTDRGVTAQFHVSWTNWRNVFSFEAFGTKGYVKIEGLGGSYGPETLETGIRKPEGGRPDIEVLEFPAEDVSWKREWGEFKSAVREGRDPVGSGLDGLRANEVIEALLRSSREKRTVPV
jgi:predicted dehydrogenase